jgi:hypothetical protein
MSVDHRSDIYSLGAIMYELFCGQPMFRGRSFGEYVRKHLTEVPVLPRQTPNGAGIDERLEALIMKCLAKDPNERFAHILELRDGLLHMLAGIETLPPGSIVLAHSAIRSAPTVSPQGLPPHMLPLPAPAMVTTQPTPQSASHLLQSYHSQLSGSGMHPSLMYSHQTPLPEAEKPTPWWVWFVGGAVAVALGIGGALWYAGSSSTPAPTNAAQAQPRTEPIVQPTTKLVELRFDSLPSGGVYADGRSAELCQTPCKFVVDLNDGGPTDKRTFVVRADGYEDKRVEVDLNVSQRDFSVSLARIAPTTPTTPAVVDTGSATDPVDTVDLTEADGKKPGRKGRKGRKTVDKPVDPPVDTDPKIEPKVEAKPVDPPPDQKTDDKKPEDKKPVNKIDRTDTIDPFHKK